MDVLLTYSKRLIAKNSDPKALKEIFSDRLYVDKGHGRIEKRTLTTSEMLYAYAVWLGLAHVYHLEREFQW